MADIKKAVGANHGNNGTATTAGAAVNSSIAQNFPFATDLAGLLEQAESRKAQAEAAGDEAAAVAHRQIWNQIYPLVVRESDR